jgi:hypothetical protein
MAVPALAAWMKETNDVFGKRVATAQIRPFFEITAVATPATIVGTVAPAMLLCNNVLDVERR